MDTDFQQPVALRIVLLTIFSAVAVDITAKLRDWGHDPVAIVTVPSSGTRRDLAQPVLERFREVVTTAPWELDLLIPSEKARIASLVAACEPDVLICVGFPWLLPVEALAVPRLGAVNGHPSLLPRWRGPNPIGWTLRAGDPVIGWTYHRMDERFDTGPILAQGSLPIEDDDDLGSLFAKLASLEEQLLPRALERLCAGDPGDSQPEEEATYAGRFEDDYVWIDWSRPAREVHNQVRAWISPTVGGLMGARARIAGETVRVLRTRLVSATGSRASPGTVLSRENDELLIECADGPICVLELERYD